MFYWRKFAVVGLISFFSLMIFTINCSPVRRHKVLTFFLDGVPPLGGEPNDAINVGDSNSPSANVGEGANEPNVVWYSHLPPRECKKCHDMSRPPTRVVRRPQFVKEPPGLCYDCHPETNYADSSDFVHGPVASGECVFCHAPHGSKNKYLLKEPIPEICLSCHSSEDVELIDNHSEANYASCDRCHLSHASLEEGLLREDWKGKD